MADAVVVPTARTAIGTAFKGSLVDLDACELDTLAGVAWMSPTRRPST